MVAILFEYNIIVERMSLYGCSDVTCRGKVTRLQGVSDVGAGRETITCESAAGVSFISSARCWYRRRAWLKSAAFAAYLFYMEITLFPPSFLHGFVILFTWLTKKCCEAFLQEMHRQVLFFGKTQMPPMSQRTCHCCRITWCYCGIMACYSMIKACYRLRGVRLQPCSHWFHWVIIKI